MRNQASRIVCKSGIKSYRVLHGLIIAEVLHSRYEAAEMSAPMEASNSDKVAKRYAGLKSGVQNL